MRKALLLLFVATLSIRCGNSNSPSSTTVTINGTVTATNGGTPVSGVTVVIGSASSVTNSGGGYSLSVPTGSTRTPVTVQGAAIVTRGVWVIPTQSQTLNIDAIQLAGFDPVFYKELVRNAFDAPTSIQALKRLTKNVSIFIGTDGVDAATLAMIDSVSRDSVPKWTGGMFQVVAVETGILSPHLSQTGWLNFQLAQNPNAGGECGHSNIAADGGIIALYTPNCASFLSCGYLVPPSVVRHELGHSFGFYHTDSKADNLYPILQGCDVPISAREQAAAAIAYRRPNGNTDPDTDPPPALSLLLAAPGTIR